MSEYSNIEGNVEIKMSYGLIKHFSEHLYKSPNKAIEEIVINGFDAGAKWVDVYLNGLYGKNKIIVWDNGESMDVDGLNKLWQIANSPKSEMGGGDRIINVNGEERKIIGKFGIGKLASYALGDEIIHLCKKAGKYLLVSIDYVNLMHERKKTDDEVNKYSQPIYNLNEEEALNYIMASFNKHPDDLLDKFREDTWTFVSIGKIKETKITFGRLRWVLQFSMPITPSFTLRLDTHALVPNIKKNGLIVEWDFSEPEVRKYLNKQWEINKNNNKVQGDIEFGSSNRLDAMDPSREVPYVFFPNIGIVHGNIMLYKQSLLNVRENDEDGRSYGFFIYVRNRLINIDNEKLFLKDPSFATFYCSQFVLYIDDLDDQLSADREGFFRDSKKIDELEILQKAIYDAIAYKQRDNLKVEEPKGFLLPVRSLVSYIEPLASLYVKNKSTDALTFDIKNPPSYIEPTGVDKEFAEIDFQKGIVFNGLHPLRESISKAYGNSHRMRVLSEVEKIVLSDVLLEGFLYSMGLDEERIERIMKWKDEYYRSVARQYPGNLENIIQNMENASYSGDKKFEVAVGEVLKAIGFIVEIDGKPGKKDILAKANCGDESYKLTFELKGKKNEAGVPNDAAEVAGANAHRVEAEAEHAVIITRQFAGFKNEELPAILKECQPIGTVSIMQTNHLAEILRVVWKYPYSLDVLKPVFTIIESPEDKLNRIKQLDNPDIDFDYQELLEIIWEQQRVLGDGDLVSAHNIWLGTYKHRGRSKEEFLSKLQALRMFAFPLFKYENDLVGLTNTPEMVLRQIFDQFGR